MKLPKIHRIHLGVPQWIAAALLLCLVAQCAWVIHRQQLTPADYRYARCGREMWERPSPLAGYFTSCGNLNGDGIFAYRAAGLPLTAQRFVLQAIDRLRSPETRVYAQSSLDGSTWEARHQLSSIVWLIHMPFVLFAALLGGGLWWVSRRLFGTEGGVFALGLYCFTPAVVRAAVTPNNDVLAMWGLYGTVYTAIGVAHAMQGPRRKWRPRIVLLAVALGFTAAAHLLAAIIGLIAAFALMLYLAERRRGYVTQILLISLMGAVAILFAFFAFRPDAFAYVFTGGAARFWFSLNGLRTFFESYAHAPVAIALVVAMILYLGVRRCRYFGNTAPFLLVLAIFPLMTTQVASSPWLWSLPFLFTFLGGVFADAIETDYRRMFLILMGCILTTQAVISISLLPAAVSAR